MDNQPTGSGIVLDMLMQYLPALGGAFILIALLFFALQIAIVKTSWGRKIGFAFPALIPSEAHGVWGAYGEHLISQKLRQRSSRNAVVLNNLYLPTADGETSEIDVLMIDEYGLWVIESKYYRGWIFGSERQGQWTQSLPKGRGKASEKKRFLNPLKQNQKHVENLQAVVGTELPVFPLVIFGEKATFKKLELSPECAPVINFDDLTPTLKKLRANAGQPRLGTDQIREVAARLQPYTQVSDEVKAAHIERIKANQNVA